MILSTILTMCVLSTTGGHECDVRVQYLQEVTSMQECKKDMQQLAVRMMAEILNAIPEYFRGIGYSYNVTFY